MSEYERVPEAAIRAAAAQLRASHRRERLERTIIAALAILLLAAIAGGTVIAVAAIHALS